MQITNNAKRRRISLWLASAIGIALVALGCLYLLKLGPFSTTPPTTQQPTPEEQAKQTATENDEKRDFAEANKNNELPGKETPPPTSPDTIELTPTKDSGTVTIKTKLIGYPDGNCVLTATNGSKTTQKEAAIIYQPEFSSCAGFSILISELGTGPWRISLTVTPTGGSPITKNAELSV